METSSIIEWGGFLIIVILVFVETGLLVGLVVPGGETLVFTAGLLVSTNTLDVSVSILLSTLILASLAGDTSGYLIGKKFGRKLYHKTDTWYFKKEYLHLAANFIHQHRKTALIFGKFLPVIRPFCPVLSGATDLRFSFFMALTVVASLLYMSVYVLTGFYLGSKFPVIKEYLGWILPISIIVAIIPIYIKIRNHKKASE